MATPPLEYEKAESTQLRRQYRRLMALTLLNTILLAGFVIGPTIGPMVKAQWNAFQERRERRRFEAERRANMAIARTYTAPADQIVYEERPDEAAKLLAEPSSAYRTIRGGKPIYLVPHPWQPPVYRANTPQPPLAPGGTPLLFIHARRSHAGQERLVRVVLNSAQGMSPYDARPEPLRRDYSITTIRQLLAEVLSDNGSVGETIALRLGDDKTSKGRAIWHRAGSGGWEQGNIEYDVKSLYRFYAGQVDPADESHFTIDYEVDGVRGTIDGWLRDNDAVELRPRTGGMVDRDPRGREIVWDPALAPTTKP